MLGVIRWLKMVLWNFTQKKLCVKVKWKQHRGNLKATLSCFPSMLKKSGHVSLLAGKMCVCVVRKLCLLTTHQSVKRHRPDCFSWPSKRHGQAGNASVCFALRLISPVNLLILCVCVRQSGCTDKPMLMKTTLNNLLFPFLPSALLLSR